MIQTEQNTERNKRTKQNTRMKKQAGAELSQAQPNLKLMLRVNYTFIMIVGLSK